MKAKYFIPLIIASTLGCSTVAKTAAVETVVASDRIADTLADDWSELTHDRISECQKLNLTTESDRENCLKPFTPAETDKLIAAVKVLVLVQTAIKDAAECESFNTCKDSVDWEDLSSRIMDAWNGIKPYVMIVKGEKQ